MVTYVDLKGEHRYSFHFSLLCLKNETAKKNTPQTPCSLNSDVWVVLTTLAFSKDKYKMFCSDVSWATEQEWIYLKRGRKHLCTLTDYLSWRSRSRMWEETIDDHKLSSRQDDKTELLHSWKLIKITSCMSAHKWNNVDYRQEKL